MLMPRPWLLLLLLPGMSMADVIRPLPPDQEELRDYAQKHPEYYEHADQFCAGRSINSACVIPGNPFAGGGKGQCRQTINYDRNNASVAIEADCVLDDPITIDRQLPPGGYRVDSGICNYLNTPDLASSTKELLEYLHASCESTSPVVDRFCSNKEVGDTCAAEILRKQIKETYPGRCIREADMKPYYSWGYRVATREIIICKPDNPVVRKLEKSSPPGWWKRLFEHFFQSSSPN